MVNADRLYTFLYVVFIFLESYQCVKAKLKITGNSRYGHIGEDFVFSCVAPSIPYLLYWQRNGFPVASQELTLNGCSALVHSSPNYTYSCTVNTFMLRIPGENMTSDENVTSWSCSGYDWSKSNIYHLIVIVPVREVQMFRYIDTYKSNDTDTVTLSCESNPCRPQAQVKWYNGDQEITSNVAVQVQKIDGLYMARSNVTINITQVDAEHIYCKASSLPTEKVVVSNTYSFSDKDSEFINMYLINNNSRITVDGTKDINFICDRNTSDFRDWALIENSKRYLKPERSLGHPLMQLQYPKCTDSSNYTCRTGYSDNYVEVIVQCKPVVIHTIPPTVNTSVGEQIELELDVTAFPIPVITCMFKGTDQHRDSNLQECKMNITVSSQTMIHHKFTLTKDKMEQEDLGKYEIVIENGIGKERLVFTVSLEDSRQIKTPLLPVIFGSLSGLLLFILVFIAVGRRLKIRKVTTRSNQDRQIQQAMTESFKSSSDLSEDGMEMFVFVSGNMAEYENDCRMKEIEADSVYHDLEPEDVERTKIEWPYEDVEDKFAADVPDLRRFVFVSGNMAEYENDCRMKEIEADSVYHDLEPEDVERTKIEWPYEDVEDKFAADVPDLRRFVFVSGNMAEYENDCRMKEIEADSVYHDLEPEDVERTKIEWPYEDVEDKFAADVPDLRSFPIEDMDCQSCGSSGYIKYDPKVE